MIIIINFLKLYLYNDRDQSGNQIYIKVISEIELLYCIRLYVSMGIIVNNLQIIESVYLSIQEGYVEFIIEYVIF